MIRFQGRNKLGDGWGGFSCPLLKSEKSALISEKMP